MNLGSLNSVNQDYRSESRSSNSFNETGSGRCPASPSLAVAALRNNFTWKESFAYPKIQAPLPSCFQIENDSK